ncbi:hypothetical protein Tco_1349094, partial [Tanacetum coccineum]
SPGSSISMSVTCFFSSLISLDNSVNFEGSSSSSVGKQLAKSYEAKSFENLGFKEDTKSSEMEDEALKCLQIKTPHLYLDVGPPAACCASLCISPTTGVEGEGWLALLSLAKLD